MGRLSEAGERYRAGQSRERTAALTLSPERSCITQRAQTSKRDDAKSDRSTGIRASSFKATFIAIKSGFFTIWATQKALLLDFSTQGNSKHAAVKHTAGSFRSIFAAHGSNFRHLVVEERQSQSTTLSWEVIRDNPMSFFQLLGH